VTRVPALGSRGEGWLVLQGICFALIVAAVAAAPREPVTDPEAVGNRQLAGYVIGMVAAVLIGSGIAELRRARALAALPRPRAEAALARTGAYRLVRHPIYGGLILGALGLAVITPWVGTFIAVALLAVVLDLKRRREEAWLADRYSEYAAYKARTKALLPYLY
jgi:protein-S-isoprenylcysteine O-methyltransferase Ste14